MSRTKGHIPPKRVSSKFTWGPIQQLHRVGADYVIVEYLEDEPANAPSGWKPKVMYHPYVYISDVASDAGGRWPDQWYNTGHSYRSLDEALVAAVVFRNLTQRDGLNAALNEKLTGYLLRIIQKKPKTRRSRARKRVG